jgi:hypothetical protein
MYQHIIIFIKPKGYRTLQNQILQVIVSHKDDEDMACATTYKIPDTSNCVAQTPPPAAAKPLPKLFGELSVTVHPEG